MKKYTLDIPKFKTSEGTIQKVKLEIYQEDNIVYQGVFSQQESSAIVFLEDDNYKAVFIAESVLEDKKETATISFDVSSKFLV